MYTEIKSAKTGKVLLAIGKKPVELTEEQKRDFAQQFAEIKRRTFEEMQQPSSEEGKRLFYSRVSLIETPFIMLADIWYGLMGRDVWYAASGWRSVR